MVKNRNVKESNLEKRTVILVPRLVASTAFIISGVYLFTKILGFGMLAYGTLDFLIAGTFWGVLYFMACAVYYCLPLFYESLSNKEWVLKK